MNPAVRSARSILVFLMLVECSTAFTQVEANLPDRLPMESQIDVVVAKWPEVSQDFDTIWAPIAALVEAAKVSYEVPLATHHSVDRDEPVWDRTPQSLVNRDARIISRSSGIVHRRDGSIAKRPPPMAGMPRQPRYYGIQSLVPVPGKPTTWSDFLVMNDTDRRVHAARFDERNILREIVLIKWEGKSWRALELSCYPNGAPQCLRFWEDGVPAISRTDWTPAGEHNTVVVREGQYEGEPSVAVCSVAISYLPPGFEDDGDAAMRRPFPMPVGALHLVPVGGAGSIEAPLLADYDFAGWTGEATGTSPQLDVRPVGPIGLVAHYIWNRRYADHRRHVAPAIEEAVRRLPGGIAEIGSSYDLLDISELDLSATNLDNLDDLTHFRWLRNLDISKTSVNDLFVLSPYAAVERALAGPTSLQQEDLFNRVLLALHAGVAPPVDTLTVRDTDLSRTYGMEFLSGLKHLDVGRSQMGSLEFVPTLDALESLYAAQNNITDVAPLVFIGPVLRSINLDRNILSELTPLTNRTVWPEGMALSVKGNSLSPDALCSTIPELQAMGVVVTFDGDCGTLAGKISDEDQDGDRYTNREEWQFVSLFSALEPERELQFAAAIQDADTPRGYLANLPQSAAGEKVSIDQVPTTIINFEIVGKGSVYPGHGTHKFANKIFNEDGTWAWHTITIRPAASPGWAMVPLDEYFFDGEFLKREESGPGIVASMESSTSLRFEFRQVKQALSIDLVDALKTFVEKYYPTEDPFTFDHNDLVYHSDKPDAPGPNGMPDAAELRLIQAILQTPSYDYYYKGGTSFTEATDLWEANLAISERALGEVGTAEPYLVHLLAGFATLGSFEDRGAFLAMIQELKGLILERDQFEQGLYNHLAPDETIHNRATRNEDIWKQVSAGRKIDRKVVDAYAAAVLAQASE